MKDMIDIQPKWNHVEDTAEMLRKASEIKKTYKSRVGETELFIFPGVFNPEIFFSSAWFASEVSTLVKGEKDFLEIGCGTGIVSISVAMVNPEIHIVASDTSAVSVENTQKNIMIHYLEKRVSVFKSDVFDDILLVKKFDTVFWAMPFGYLKPEARVSETEMQVYDPGYRSISKFFRDSGPFLKKEGRLLIGFSSNIGHFELLENLAKSNGFTLRLIGMKKGIEMNPVNMEIWEAKKNYLMPDVINA